MSDAQRTYLFTDFRHIRCGDVVWRDPGGEKLGSPPAPPFRRLTPEARFLPWGVRLQAQPAEQLGPDDGLANFEGTVIQEEGGYRSWKLAIPEGPETLGEVSVICRESDDGFAWRTAAECPIDTGGQFKLMGSGFFRDDHGTPAERYKAVWTARAPREQWEAIYREYSTVHPRYRDWRIHPARKVMCVYGAVSPDGLAWTALPEPLLIHMSDTDSAIYFDERLGRYVFYTRWYNDERRSVGRTESDDFRHWDPVMPCLEVPLDNPTVDIYTNGRTSYPGAPNYHLMFPMFYERWTQESDIRLYSSTDGMIWKEVPGGPVIRPGQAGTWDGYFLYSSRNLVELPQDRIGVPYAGTRYPHKYPRWPEVVDDIRSGWAVWPRDRLSALVADRQGEVFTFPMRPSGRELRLNVRTREAGEVRVGVLRAEGQIADGTDRLPDREAVPVSGRGVEDCVRISGDHASAVVRWRTGADLGVGPDDSVMLHITMRAAELFAFKWV